MPILQIKKQQPHPPFPHLDGYGRKIISIIQRILSKRCHSTDNAEHYSDLISKQYNLLASMVTNDL